MTSEFLFMPITEVFSFLRNNGLSIDGFYFSFFDFFIYCLAASILIGGIAYILKN